jgi:predicted RNase H-like HicB family nuclease
MEPISRGRRKIDRMSKEPCLSDYKIVLFAQDRGWVAEVPSTSGCYALMKTREEAIQELEKVFQMIREEYADRGESPFRRTRQSSWRTPGATAREFQTVAARLGFASPERPEILRQLGITPEQFADLRR